MNKFEQNVDLQEYDADAKQAEKTVNALTENETDEENAFTSAASFLQQASDDDVIEMVDGILAVPAHQRDQNAIAMLNALEGRYGTINFKKDYAAAEDWYRQTEGGELSELLSDDAFKDFVEGSTAPLKDMVKKYLKFSEKAKKPKSPGSVRDKGGTAAKEYYTPGEVDKLTEAQLSDPKIWAKVRESMTKWK